MLRLAAAAGCEIARAVDPAEARRGWLDAPLVLLDADAARPCAEGRAAPARRRRGRGVRRAAAAGVASTRSRSAPSTSSSLPRGRSPGWSRRSPRPPRAPAAPAPVLAVVGGRGGAGASVFAAALAVTAVRDGERALLVDCDPLGGGLDLVLGAEDVGGLRWPEIGVGGGRVPAAALHAALPRPAVGGGGRAGSVCCPATAPPHGPTPAAVVAVLEAGRRAGETVVCDLPRYPTDAAVAALGGADLTLAGGAGRRALVRRGGPGRRRCSPSTAARCRRWSCAGRRRAGSTPTRSPVRSGCRCSPRCGPSRGWPARWSAGPGTALGRCRAARTVLAEVATCWPPGGAWHGTTSATALPSATAGCPHTERAPQPVPVPRDVMPHRSAHAAASSGRPTPSGSR